MISASDCARGVSTRVRSVATWVAKACRTRKSSRCCSGCVDRRSSPGTAISSIRPCATTGIVWRTSTSGRCKWPSTFDVFCATRTSKRGRNVAGVWCAQRQAGSRPGECAPLGEAGIVGLIRSGVIAQSILQFVIVAGALTERRLGVPATRCRGSAGRCGFCLRGETHRPTLCKLQGEAITGRFSLSARGRSFAAPRPPARVFASLGARPRVACSAPRGHGRR